MTVRELNREQLNELKQNYVNHYDGIDFTDDDFFL